MTFEFASAAAGFATGAGTLCYPLISQSGKGVAQSTCTYTH